jgi:DNA-binding transcriptional LysR family regulator
VDPDYELFATVVATGSLSAAARALAISPAMVSKRLARLEARLGTRLVHRTTRRLSLTSAGAGFHTDVLAILGAIEAAEGAVSGTQAVRGPLCVTAPTAFGRLYVAPHLKKFLDLYPQIELRLDLSDGFSDLLSDQIDLAIRIAPAIGAGLAAHRLASSRRILCAAPAYLAEAGTPSTIAALADHRLLAADGQMPWRLHGPRGPVTVDHATHVRTNSSEVARALALAGVGIALRSLWEVGRDIAEGRLARVLPDHEGSIDVGIYAVHPATPLVPRAVAALIDHLTDLYRTPPWDA